MSKTVEESCACHVRGDFKIVYCPLHAAAPDLLNALNQAAKLAHKNTRNHSYWLSFRECKQTTCAKAAKAIKKTENASPKEQTQ